jgi:hypothetical protein
MPNSDSLILPLLPLYVAAAGMAIEHACQYEQQVGQPVDVPAWRLVQGFGCAQRDDRTLGAAANGPADVRNRRRA